MTALSTDAPDAKPVARRCVSCREAFPRTQLLRITHDRAQQQFSINNNPPGHGRSAYVCQNQRCLGLAIKGKKLQKALKSGIPDDILGTLSQFLKDK